MFAGVNLLQKPINPHRQKLLAASKRAAKVETGPGMEGPEPKAKAKSKGKVKAPKGSPKPKPKAVPKVKAGKASEMKEVQEKAKNDYNGAKKTFFDSFFGYDHVGLHTCFSGLWWMFTFYRVLVGLLHWKVSLTPKLQFGTKINMYSQNCARTKDEGRRNFAKGEGTQVYRDLIWSIMGVG